MARPSQTGISNRESAEREAAERAAHPPVDGGRPDPQDASGRTGDAPLERHRDGQTSHKAGSSSVERKMSETRHADHSSPASRKVAGAFGREHGGTSRDHEQTSHPDRDPGLAAPDTDAKSDEEIEEEIDEEIDESFPASDPPSHTPTVGPKPARGRKPT